MLCVSISNVLGPFTEEFTVGGPLRSVTKAELELNERPVDMYNRQGLQFYTYINSWSKLLQQVSNGI